MRSTKPASPSDLGSVLSNSASDRSPHSTPDNVASRNSRPDDRLGTRRASRVTRSRHNGSCLIPLILSFGYSDFVWKRISEKHVRVEQKPELLPPAWQATPGTEVPVCAACQGGRPCAYRTADLLSAKFLANERIPSLGMSDG